MVGGEPKIAIVGAGGWVFPLEIVRDILAHPALSASVLTLYDVRPDAAERTLHDVEALIELGGLAARAEVTGTLRDALSGTDFVITVFQVGGIEAYGHDVLIPREYGIDQTVGDTLGPGGIFRGLRTVEALRVVAEAMLEICPEAWLLNYANPMSINCWATDLLGVKVVGMCHSVQRTSNLLARELGIPYEEVDVRLRRCEPHGLVHRVPPRRRGSAADDPRDHARATHRALDPADASYGRVEGIERVRTELMLLTGYFHTESSHHASEYWAWFRKNPELTVEYLDRRWDYLEICRERGRLPRATRTIVEEARRRRAAVPAASSPRRSWTVS